MADQLQLAQWYVDQGDLRRALNALWEENTDAASQGDVSRLEAVHQLASLIVQRSSGQVQRDARSLVRLVESELGALGRPTPVAVGASEAGLRAEAGTIDARLESFARAIARVEREHREQLAELELELSSLRALARAQGRAAPAVEHPPVERPRQQASWAETLAADRVSNPTDPEPSEDPLALYVDTGGAAGSPDPGRRPETSLDRAFSGLGARLRDTREQPLLELVGARALAWVGGVVLLLGVVLLFVLAVNRGWIGPEIRVGVAAVASLAAFVGGLVIERRFGRLYAAIGGVGAGLAGGYVTLTAATVMYEFVPQPVALALAVVIAAVGTVIAIAWSSQAIGVLGLIGAMAALPVIERGPSVMGGAFLSIVTAAALTVAIRQEWPGLLIAAWGVSLLQVGALVLS